MADLAGKLKIDLSRDGIGTGVTIRSSRPVSASRVFVGKGVDETAAALPTLYSICSIAQSCACAAACEAVLELPQLPAIARLRRLLVDAETVREHLWRLLLDWPSLLGDSSEGQPMARVMTAFSRLRGALGGEGDLFRPGSQGVEPDLSVAAGCLEELDAVIGAHVLGTPPSRWLVDVETGDDLIAWSRDTSTAAALLLRKVSDNGWAALGRSRVSALPILSPADLEAVLGSAGVEGFLAEPLWNDNPAETSPYTRNRGDAVVTGLSARFGNGLLPRLAAQLVEVAALYEDLQEGLADSESSVSHFAAGIGDGVGIARVEAARGLLVHRVAIDGDRIRDYRILAPTEWNFHPQGAVARGLAKLEAVDEATLDFQARLFVTAVDPCVDYDVTVR